jgi:hypothetical protein
MSLNRNAPGLWSSQREGTRASCVCTRGSAITAVNFQRGISALCVEYPVKTHSSASLVPASNNTTYLAPVLIVRYLASRKQFAGVSHPFAGPKKLGIWTDLGVLLKRFRLSFQKRLPPLARVVVVVYSAMNGSSCSPETDLHVLLK